LEKIEMKKTLVAVAAIAAFSAAQAEVTLSGGINYGLTQVSTSSTKTKLTGGDSNQFNNVAFSAGEDLGNGMKVSVKYDLGLDYSAGAGAGYTRESHIDLATSAGSIALGRQYVPIFLATTVDPVGLPALSIGQEAQNSVFLTQSNRDVRNNGAFSYVSPSFSGFTGNYFTSVATTGAGATVGYGLKYAAGAFSAEYQTQQAGDEGVAYYANDTAAGTNVTFTIGTNKTKRQIGAFKYDAGVANFVYIYGSAKNNALGITSNYIAVGAPIPGSNFNVAAGYNMGSSTVANASAKSTRGSIYRVNYAFSKRTGAYYIYGSDQSSANSRTTTSSSIGLSHNF